MRKRRYRNWKLEHLKLSLASSDCGHGHYQIGCMNIVARCIPGKVRLELENDCFCERPSMLGSAWAR
jgi:hypothetical protein